MKFFRDFFLGVLYEKIPFGKLAIGEKFRWNGLRYQKVDPFVARSFPGGNGGIVPPTEKVTVLRL